MAKKKTTTSDSADAIFAQLIAQQNAIQPNSASTGLEMSSATKMWLHTGSDIADVVLSNKECGGWPGGRVIEIFGEEGIGKTTLAFAAMAATQKAGGIAIFFDVEQAGAEDILEACGVNRKTLIYSNMEIMEDIFQAMEKNLATIIDSKKYDDKPIFICLDSLAAMTTNAEVEGTYDHNMNTSTLKAKQMGHVLRKIVPYLNKGNVTLMIINQERDKLGVMFGDKKTQPGGNALKFTASIRCRLSGAGAVKLLDPAVQAEYDAAIAKWDDEVADYKKLDKDARGKKPLKPKSGDFKGDEIIIGNDVEMFTIKNKTAPPKRKAKFRIIFGEGIQQEPAWFDYGLKYSLIEKTGPNKYEITGMANDVGVFGESEWMDIIMEDPELHEFFRQTLVSKMVRPITTREQREIEKAQAIEEAKEKTAAAEEAEEA